MKRDFVGVDSIQALGRLFAKYNVKRTFLVTGKDSYEISGAREAIEQLLDEYGVQAQRFSDFSPNPKLEDVILGVR